jgi:hypothetical protein
MSRHRLIHRGSGGLREYAPACPAIGNVLRSCPGNQRKDIVPPPKDRTLGRESAPRLGRAGQGVKDAG